MNNAKVAIQLNISRQAVHQYFNNNSKIYQLAQLQICNMEIDEKIEEYKARIHELKELKIEVNKQKIEDE